MRQKQQRDRLDWINEAFYGQRGLDSSIGRRENINERMFNVVRRQCEYEMCEVRWKGLDCVSEMRIMKNENCLNLWKLRLRSNTKLPSFLPSHYPLLPPPLSSLSPLPPHPRHVGRNKKGGTGYLTDGKSGENGITEWIRSPFCQELGRLFTISLVREARDHAKWGESSLGIPFLPRVGSYLHENRLIGQSFQFGWWEWKMIAKGMNYLILPDLTTGHFFL